MNNDFTDFYEATFQPVSRAVSAFCGDSDVAHEVTQEAFARAYARWTSLRDAQSSEGWVTKTAMNLARRHFRRTSKGRTLTKDQSSPEPTGDRVDLLEALHKLPPRQQEAIVLHYLMGLPVAVVAEVMRLSVGAVKAHLHKGRTALKDPLEVRHA